MSDERLRNPVVMVSAVVQHFDSVLLVKRKQSDGEVWSFPEVRLEWGETLPQTVEHAARLAAGVTVRAGDIIQACDSIVHEGDTETVLQHHLVIDMAAEYLTGELQPGDGVLDVAWASGLALKSMPVEANAAELLADLGVIQ